MPQHRQDEDIDSILSSIMQGHHPSMPRPEPAPQKRPAHHSQVTKETAQLRDTPVQISKKPLQPAYAPVQDRAPLSHTPQNKSVEPSKPMKKHRLKKRALVIPATVLALATLGFFAQTYLSLSSSPFASELSASTKYPLLYPGKLPAGFAIDKTSVSQSSNGATIYAIKGKDNKIINISLQKQPSGLNLQPLYDTMTGVKKVDTPAGDTTIGVSKDNMLTANTLSGDVWVIVRTQVDSISMSDFEALLKSFKQG